MTRLPVRVAIALLGLCTSFISGVALGRYYADGWALVTTTISPDHTEQLEFYSADRWHRMLNPQADLLGFVRLTRLPGGEPIATSDAFELSGQGEAFWSKDGVQVGTSMVYDRATGQWSAAQ